LGFSFPSSTPPSPKKSTHYSQTFAVFKRSVREPKPPGEPEAARIVFFLSLPQGLALGGQEQITFPYPYFISFFFVKKRTAGISLFPLRVFFLAMLCVRLPFPCVQLRGEMANYQPFGMFLTTLQCRFGLPFCVLNRRPLRGYFFFATD